MNNFDSSALARALAGTAMLPFADRIAAGRALAAKLSSFANRTDVVVLGLPRGGVPVAAEVAAALSAPLDVCVVRKIGVPGHDEFAMGAIASGGIVELDRSLIQGLGITDAAVAAVVQRERAELARREKAYRNGRAAPAIAGRTVILVDDGLATGSTMRAAVNALRVQRPVQLVVAVPVGAPEACAALAKVADACVCVARPDPFQAVGLWYVDFRPTSDAEVLACLEDAAARMRDSSAQGSSR